MNDSEGQTDLTRLHTAPTEARADDTGAAGRAASFLLVLAGLVTMASVLLPEPEGFRKVAVLVVGMSGSVFGVIVYALPWKRWPNAASLALVAPALALIGLHNWYGGQDPFRYSIFFLVVFVWVGTFHRRGMSVLLAVPTTITYLVPLLLAGASASALASAGYAVPLFVVVGEIVAWRTSQVGALEAELRDAASHDPLTGLANRRLAMDQLQTALARIGRSAEQVFVLFVDVDGFKSINDSLGHEAGDLVLKQVASALSMSVRPSDTVARLAGDEFLLIVESSAEDAGARTAQRVLDRLRPHPSYGSDAVMPTVSIGVARTSDDRTAPSDLLRAADAALYQAKQSGKDGFACAAAVGVGPTKPVLALVEG